MKHLMVVVAASSENRRLRPRRHRRAIKSLVVTITTTTRETMPTEDKSHQKDARLLEQTRTRKSATRSQAAWQSWPMVLVLSLMIFAIFLIELSQSIKLHHHNHKRVSIPSNLYGDVQT